MAPRRSFKRGTSITDDRVDAIISSLESVGTTLKHLRSGVDDDDVDALNTPEVRPSKAAW